MKSKPREGTESSGAHGQGPSASPRRVWHVRTGTFHLSKRFLLCFLHQSELLAIVNWVRVLDSYIYDTLLNTPLKSIPIEIKRDYQPCSVIPGILLHFDPEKTTN